MYYTDHSLLSCLLPLLYYVRTPTLSTEYYSPSPPLAITKISRAPQLKEITFFWKLPKSTGKLLNTIVTLQMCLELHILKCWDAVDVGLH